MKVETVDGLTKTRFGTSAHRMIIDCWDSGNSANGKRSYTGVWHSGRCGQWRGWWRIGMSG